MGPVRKFSSIVNIEVNFSLRGHRDNSVTITILHSYIMYIVQCTLYIVQSVKAAHNNGIRCNGLQSLLSNLGLTALSHVSFQNITKFLLTVAHEVIIIII